MCGGILNRGVRNPMKILDICFLKTEPNWTDLKIQKPKTRFPWFGFQKPTLAVCGRFSRCLIHSSSCSMIGSTVNVFFFVPHLCTSSSVSLRLTISWTNSAQKYVISSVVHIKQHTVQKTEPKTETAVNLVNRNRTENRTEVIFLLTAHP